MSATFSLLNRNRRKGVIISLACAITALTFALLAQSYKANNLDQDIRKLNQFVQSSQNSPSMQVFREGRDLIEQERWPQAADKFRNFVKQYPQDKNVDAALYWLAYALKKQGKFREAAQSLDRLTKEFPRSSWTNEAEAMLTEIAPQLGNQRVIDEGLSRDDDEMKVVALQSLFEANTERAINYVAEMFRPGSKASRNLKEAAISLLGSHGGKQAVPLLLEIARTQTDPEFRRIAIHRLGEEGGEAAVDDLMKLYAAERDAEVKGQVIHALSEIQGARARGKLLEIARNAGEEMELRKAAIHRLGDDDAAFEELSQIYASERNEELRAQVLHSFANMNDPRATAQLIEVARRGDDAELRRMAIHWLSDKNDPAVFDELLKMYEAERDTEIRRQILHSFSQMNNPRARAKLLDIARGGSGSDMETRLAALHWISDEGDAATIDALIRLYDAETSLEIKEALIRVFSESKHKAAVRKLIDIARRDPSTEMRKTAVRRLGESRDPEAMKFLEDLLK